MFQKVLLVGIAVKDAAVYEKNDSKMCVLRVATWHSRYNEQTGKWERDSTFHNVTVFGKAAENVKKIEKDDYVIVEGELRERKWTTKEGTQYNSFNVVGTVKKIPQRFVRDYQYPQPPAVQPTWTPDKEEDNSGAINDDLPF